MKTIILCGGYGTRLKEETEFKPKPMVYIGNKPLLWHIMKIYASYGFNDFILALGYKAEYIKDFFLNQKAFTSDFTLHTATFRTKYYTKKKDENENFKITFVDTGINTLPGERILLCQKYIPKEDTNFMLTYGDGVANINIKELVKFHKKQKTIATITGVHPRSKYGRFKIGRNKLVKEFEEKPVLSDWVNGGFMVFTHEIFKHLNYGENELAALSRLSQIQQLSLYKHDNFWYGMDTYKELEELNNLWNSDSPPWKIWK